MKQPKTKQFNFYIAAAAAVVLAACGGSSNNSTVATRVTQGALTAVSATGAKTITVNGATVDDSAATVKVDDNATGHEALQPGMVVTVKLDDNGKATEVEHHAQVRGKVDVKGASTITIGGQVVRVDDSTRFEDNTTRLGGINATDRVRVSGFPDDKGGLRATRVEKDRSSTFEFEVHGVVSALNTGAKTFTLATSNAAGATTYSVTATALPAGIANGSIVEVKSTTQPAAGGSITASLVKLDDDLGNAQLEAEVEGIVTVITTAPTATSAGQFVIAGVTVKTASTTKWVGGAPGDLTTGAKVEAEGKLDASGAIAATKVSFRDSLRLQGAATIVVGDVHSGTFTMFGSVTVHVSDVTEIEAGVNLSAVSSVEVRGYPSASGTSDVVATRIKLASSGGGGSRIFIQGPVSDVNATVKSFKILAFTIQTTGTTQFVGRGETPFSGDFFASLTAGTVVKARGASAAALSGTTLTAEEVELEDDK